MLSHYHSWGIVDGILGCSPFLPHISRIFGPSLSFRFGHVKVLYWYSYLTTCLSFFLAFFSKLSKRLTNTFSFSFISWFIIYRSNVNLHNSLCDNLPNFILPFVGCSTIQSLYVATITLGYYHLKTLRYLFLIWFSLGLIEYRLLQHGHLFLYGPVPCLNGIHSMHVLQYP